MFDEKTDKEGGHWSLLCVILENKQLTRGGQY